VLRRVFLAIAATLVVVAVVLAVSGGFRTTVGGFRISARSPLAASIAALLAGAAWFALARRDSAIAADLAAAWHALERNASRLIGVVALIAAIVAATFATRSAAGADASGYLSQARLWSWGLLPPLHFDRAAGISPDLDGWIITPLGWMPWDGVGDMHIDGAQAPTYPPGLPMLMAVPYALADVDGATAVLIASAAIATWATGMVTGGVAGIMAAAFLAFAPVFLYQSIQPMSDVPVTAAWMLCFLLVRRDKSKGVSLLAGTVCAVAVLIRPNLAPLAIVPFIASTTRRWFAAPVIVAGLFIGFIQLSWYGSPFRSGYGTAEELFSISNIIPNAARYASWLVATSPVLFIALFGFVRVRQDRHARALIVFALLVIVSYLIYAVFDQWSYLRFLLPALAVFAVFAAIELQAWIERCPVAMRLPLFLTLVVSVSAYGLFVARAFETFKLAEQFKRVEQVGEFLKGYYSERPVVISGEQSGAIRYYTLMPIVRWEAATPETLRAAITAIERSGHSTYVALDAWENEPFLAKFKDLPAVALDWPPMLEAGTSHRTRVWKLADRGRFLKGEHIETIRVP
jgi:4-amino-4-deoxy-L-arabinose transferase-like glycosyltransferase